MLCFASRALAADYMHEFAQLFAGGFATEKRSATPAPRLQIGAARLEVYFAPEDRVAQHMLAGP